MGEENLKNLDAAGLLAGEPAYYLRSERQGVVRSNPINWHAFAWKGGL